MTTDSTNCHKRLLTAKGFEVELTQVNETKPALSRS
jgi:hypothetical protein